MPTIESAKQSAVSRFLFAEQPAAFSALAVSTLPRHNITGVGIGPKIIDGRETGEECVRLYVERKVPKEAIVESNLLPSEIEGHPTDVIETGRFRAIAPASAVQVAPSVAHPGPIRTKLRPTQPGCSTGFQLSGGFVMAGTLGCVVKLGTDLFILSNNHVLADENNLPLGSPIFQPGLLDGGNPATDQVGTLTKFIPLKPGVSNLVDAAIAKYLNPALAKATFLPNVGKLRSATAITPAIQMAVEKVGRTTGYTTGQIFDVSATVRVGYTMGVLIFDDQVLIHGNSGPFSAAGDSGSIIVDQESKRATALLFAGSDGPTPLTIGNKLHHVLSALGVSLVI